MRVARLGQLTEASGHTSPFLNGFTPPLYCRGLSDQEALRLIRQAHLPDAARPAIGPKSAGAIRSRCDNHPYLLQLVCKRFLELQDLDDEMITNENISLVTFTGGVSVGK